jgi:RHS repeat-associated protein
MFADSAKQPARPEGRAHGRVAPTLSLPKGGGALHAIDETFSVNAVNGTVELAVPLPFSTTRSGFDGGTRLHYSSGGGNGPFGLGWSLTLPSIQRRTDKQLPTYRDSDDGDTFVLAGAEDLVPAMVEQLDGSWSVDERTVGAATVKRYIPRIEGAFARVEKVSVAGEAGFYWKVTSRDNVCTLYGRSAAARLADPTNANRIFRWLPEWSFDGHGNCIEYRYKPEDLLDVPDCVSEKNRLSALAPIANIYLKSISYGNRTPYLADPTRPYDLPPPSGPDYMFEAVLDYGEHDLDVPAPDMPNIWPCRRDPFSDGHAGFEVRCYRLCRRILFFHLMPELGDKPCLVRSLDFAYANFQFATTVLDREADFITQLRLTHYRRSDTGYDSKSLPPLDLSYQPLAWDKTIRTVTQDDLAGAPGGVITPYQWVDLRGEGLQGILTEQAQGWFYKENLGDGHFGRPVVVLDKPSFTGAAKGGLSFLDLNADGSRQAVSSSAPHLYFPLDDDNQWLPPRPFPNDLKADIGSADARLIDLTGDGRPDLLVTEDRVLRWYPSLGTDGYDASVETSKPWDEEIGPAIRFADGTQTIFTADMNGDGLTEIVRIRNGEVCYWPNLGYGRFGAKVTMQGAPLFDHPDRFDPARIQLSDISGTGAADVIYLGHGGFRAWINLAGNALGPPQDIDPFPGTERPNRLSVLDVLGNGTACLVWSSPLPGNTTAPLRYVDLMGGRKPYVLAGFSNNLGKTVELEYKSSSHYFLLDRAEGRPWVTKLPFPVMCLSTIRTRDAVTGAHYTETYRYRHGYYDHAEREFRGFGMVEHTDTESFDHSRPGATDHLIPAPVIQPPTRTRSWYHTGAFVRGAHILEQFAADYWVNPVEAEPRPGDVAIDTFSGYRLTPDEAREAARACKGVWLRRETYADDGSSDAGNPYTVEENRPRIRLVQPQYGNRYAVFQPVSGETLSYHYERNPADPRVTHELATVFGGLGEVLESANLAYARRTPDPALPATVQQVQAKLGVTYSVHGYTSDCISDQFWQLRHVCEAKTFELTGFLPAGAIATAGEVAGAFASAAPRAYEAPGHPGLLEARMLMWHRTLFADDTDPNTALPLTTLSPLGLVYQDYELTFTPGLLAALYGGRVDDTMLAEGAYIKAADLKAAGLFPAGDPDAWWNGEGTLRYPANPDQHFYLPEAYLDPYGKATSVHYRGGDHLLIDRVSDVLGNATIVEAFDFRLLQPQTVQDINTNITTAAFDILGFVAGTAVMGKGAEADDLTGFQTDPSQAQIDAFFADPLTQGPALLANATSRFIYDLSRQPAVAAGIRRETHAAVAMAAGTPSRLHYAFEYTDGFGHVVMTKAEAEPGPAKRCMVAADGTYTIDTIDTLDAPRWLGSGRLVLNNKGKPVLKYEPYFSVTPNFETEPELVETGVSAVLTYDPVGRLIRTDFPDATYSYVEFDAWSERRFDQNDTVLSSGWYAARIGGGLGAAERTAAQRTAVHDSTPAVTHCDPQGHTICGVAHNKYVDPDTALVTEDFPTTVTALDILGRTLDVTDARGNTAVIKAYDFAGHAGYTLTADGGPRWTLSDAMGKSLYGWDVEGNRFHTLYDILNRPIQHEVLKATGGTVVFSQTLYGTDPSKNQNGKAIRQHDKSGVVTNDLYDFKGNLLSSTRTFAENVTDDISWTDPAAITLQTDSYTASTTYDAMNRAVVATAPDGSVTRDTYGLGGLLNGVTITLPGKAEMALVSDIRHDVHGRRERIIYANGTESIFDYDPLTFRVRRIRTGRSVDGAVLQDLNYTYDPVGNVIGVSDGAQQTIYFNGSVVTPDNGFVYDALYRLRLATGRELIGLNAPISRLDIERSGQAHPADGSALRNYRQRYDFDAMGNMVAMAHASGAGPFISQWTRTFTPDTTTNRLACSAVGATAEAYTYDVHGNMTSMPGLSVMSWDFDNEFRSADLGGGGQVHYTYDSSGHRARKVVERITGTIEERLYVGALEIFTRTIGGKIDLRRTTLLVMDHDHHLAQVDTRTDGDDGTPQQLVRYQISNHLGSASLELDDAGQIITYEEYYPFGSTSFQSVDSSREVPARRYRYTGKERDEETGLYYHGARYYAPWLARWTAPDPAEDTDGYNLYQYVHANPVRLTDPSGLMSWGAVAGIAAAVVVGTVVTVATAGLAGPIVGATAAAIIGAAAGGAVGGGVGEAIEAHIDHRESHIVQAMAVGAVVGAVTAGLGPAARALAKTPVGQALVRGPIGRAASAVASRVSGSAIAQGARSVARRVGQSVVGRAGAAVGRGYMRGARFIARPFERLGTGIARRTISSAEIRAASTQMNVMRTAGVQRSTTLAQPGQTFRHAVGWRGGGVFGPEVTGVQVEASSALRVTPGGAYGHWGEGAYAFPGPVGPATPGGTSFQFEVPPMTAVESIRVPGAADPIIRLVPPEGHGVVPIRITGTDFPPAALAAGRQRAAQFGISMPDKVPFAYPQALPTGLLGGASALAATEAHRRHYQHQTPSPVLH